MKQIISFILGIVITSLLFLLTSSSKSLQADEDTKDTIIMLQDSLINQITDRIQDQYGDDLPEYDGDLPYTIYSLKQILYER